MTKISLITLLTLFSFFSRAQAPVSEYKIVNKIHVEGDEGWDYISTDETTGRLYVSHGSMVQVVDSKTGKLVGTIADTKGVHGIALAKDLKKGYTSNGRDSSVTVFNLQTLKIITVLKVTGRNPDAILYDPASHKILTFNRGSSNATVIDAKTDKVTETIVLDGKPEFAVTDGNGKIYVNIDNKGLINVINSQTMKVEQHWPVAPGVEPSGLAIDSENNRLFSVCDNSLMVVLNSQTGTVITSLPIGERVDGVAFDPGKKRAYSSNGAGTVTVVQEESPDKFSVIENIVTQKGARTITINTKTHHIYLPTAEYASPPEPTKEVPKPRPSIAPGSFVILDIESVK